MPALLTRAIKDWTMERRTEHLLALNYGDPTRASAEQFAENVAECERRMELPYFWDALTRSVRGIVDAYTLGGQHNLWRQAERVLAPTLLVYGGRDKLISFRMARRASGSFRDSRLLTLPDGGHVAMMEYPDAVARAFRELLDETAARTAPAQGGSR
jgi:pimeloyl-ACP methyl ester carboxylesterase